MPSGASDAPSSSSSSSSYSGASSSYSGASSSSSAASSYAHPYALSSSDFQTNATPPPPSLTLDLILQKYKIALEKLKSNLKRDMLNGLNQNRLRLWSDCHVLSYKMIKLRQCLDVLNKLQSIDASGLLDKIHAFKPGSDPRNNIDQYIDEVHNFIKTAADFQDALSHLRSNYQCKEFLYFLGMVVVAVGSVIGLTILCIYVSPLFILGVLVAVPIIFVPLHYSNENAVKVAVLDSCVLPDEGDVSEFKETITLSKVKDEEGNSSETLSNEGKIKVSKLNVLFLAAPSGVQSLKDQAQEDFNSLVLQ